eukprot:gene753-8794_t
MAMAADAAPAASPSAEPPAEPPAGGDTAAAAGRGSGGTAAGAIHKITQMHADDTMPQVRSCRSLLGEGYVAGTFTHPQTQKQTRYILPRRHRELMLDRTAVIQAVNHAFRGTGIDEITEFDTDLFGYGTPLAPKFMTPMQGLTFDPQVFDGK